MSHKVIQLTQGKETLVDKDVYEWAKEFNWFTVKDRYRFYVKRKKNNKNLALHREIMNAPKGMVVDHINGNSLDNRRENLRICTNKENRRNSNISRNNISGYKGVVFLKKRRKYKACIKYNWKSIHLGYFKDPIEAAIKYDEAALKYYGNFAMTNKKLGLIK